MFLRPLLCLICMFMVVNIADAAPFAFVTNAGTGVGVDSVSIIDTSNNSIVKTVPIINPGDPSSSTHPYGVAVTSAGDRVFVSNQVSNTISVIDSSRNDFAVIKTITRTYQPSGLAVNPAGSRLYVANDDNLSVSVLDATDANFPEIASVTVQNGPQGVTVSADGTKVFVTNTGSNSVSVIDATNTSNPAVNISVGSTPVGLALLGDKLYVANYGSNSVTVINTLTNAVIGEPISLGSDASPAGVTVSLDGSKVYVSMALADKIAIIDTATDALDGSPVITTGQAPWGVDIDPVTGLLYVANSIDDSGTAPGTVTVYNTSDGTLATTVQVNKRPQAFGNFIGPMMYPITLSTSGCGTISPAAGTDNKYLVAAGFDQTFTFTPDAGCAVRDVLVDTASQGTSGTYQLSAVAAPHSISALFGYQLTVTNTPAGGTGVVTSDVGGISCGSTCSAVYELMDSVVLTATPNEGSSFTGWTGCPSAVNNVCTISIVAAKNVTATFGALVLGGDVKVLPAGTFPATIQAGYAAIASSPATISVREAYSGNEDLVFSRTDLALSLLLRGGAQDLQHGSYSGSSTIHSLVIGGSGSTVTAVEVKDINIK